jgi:hypothetical protein
VDRLRRRPVRLRRPTILLASDAWDYLIEICADKVLFFVGETGPVFEAFLCFAENENYAAICGVVF